MQAETQTLLNDLVRKAAQDAEHSIRTTLELAVMVAGPTGAGMILVGLAEQMLSAAAWTMIMPRDKDGKPLPSAPASHIDKSRVSDDAVLFAAMVMLAAREGKGKHPDHPFVTAHERFIRLRGFAFSEATGGFSVESVRSIRRKDRGKSP